MSTQRSHDLEFHIDDKRNGATRIFAGRGSFDEACGFAVSRAAATGAAVEIDVVTWTRAAARRWGGDAALEVYDADPEASVHERLVIKAESLGRIA